MDTTLVTVTLLSMGMAASLSVIVWRMLRVERERSEARVVALTSMARHATGDPRPRTPDHGHATRDLVLREAPASEAASVSATPMFAEPEVSSPWGRRFAVMAGLGLVVASVILFALTATGGTGGASRAADAAAAQPGP